MLNDLAQLSKVNKENLPKKTSPGPETFSECTAKLLVKRAYVQCCRI